MGVIAEGIPRGCQGLFTPVSLGYPLSVFNKNSTLKDIKGRCHKFQRGLGVWRLNQEKPKKITKCHKWSCFSVTGTMFQGTRDRKFIHAGNNDVHDVLGRLYGLVDRTHNIFVATILVLGCRLVLIFRDHSYTQKHSNQKPRQSLVFGDAGIPFVL